MYCPKCDMEFVEGIQVCSDCGGPLVDKKEWETQLAASLQQEEESAARENQIMAEAIQNRFEKLSDEDIEAIREERRALQEAMREPATYVDQTTKYADNRSSASAFLFVGILLVVGSAALWMGVLNLGIVTKIVMTAAAIACLAAAAVSYKAAAKNHSYIEIELGYRNQIIEDFLEKYNSSYVDAFINKSDLSEEEIALERLNFIQDRLQTDNDLPNKAFAADVAEELYTKLFE